MHTKIFMEGKPIYLPRRALPYINHYRYVPPQREWVLRLSGLKTGIDFAHIVLELGMVYEETTGVYKRICRFNSN